MLTKLKVSNYALIDSAEINFNDGFTSVTGETGAGKSVLLGAIGLLSGNRVDGNCFYEEGKKCVIEAVFTVGGSLKTLFETFDLDFEPETLIRREVAANGKSRAFINDTPVTLDVLRAVSAQLVDVHSQHDNLMVAQQDFQLNVIDTSASNKAYLNKYQISFKAWRQKVADLQKLEKLKQAAIADIDFKSYQLEELNKANLSNGEIAATEAELLLLENASDIAEATTQIANILSESDAALVPQLKLCSQLADKLAQFGDAIPDAAEIAQRLKSVYLELDDIAADISRLDIVEEDDNRVDALNERLSLLQRLMKKHGVKSETELIRFQTTLKKELETINNADQQIDFLKQDIALLHITLTEDAKVLSDSRKVIAGPLSDNLTVVLQGIGIPNAQLEVRVDKSDFTASGTDQVGFYFSANKGIALKPVKDVASGGELGRVMLALKAILAAKPGAPTLIFDEIDTGISGKVAIKVADLMQKIALNNQVIAITHLPQIAARGAVQLLVAKDTEAVKTKTYIKELDSHARQLEIATMIGGANPSASSIESARELMQLAHK